VLPTFGPNLVQPGGKVARKRKVHALSEELEREEVEKGKQAFRFAIPSIQLTC
jgi:hypothetical protein